MSNAAASHNNFARALKSIRKSKGLSQEAFSLTSSRTYVSALERSLKSPTLSKVDDLAEVLGVHPLTLLAMSYLRTPDSTAVERIWDLVSNEISELK
ncbi:helix-turn-helix domain-containing protein [Polaromonas sp. UC242_47]|uniref:helix-turn-helix domain-containing protein n=1 Tax=Polaromonas sp. UC242_47 TaxID=3374626 RepID=UPI00379D14FC